MLQAVRDVSQHHGLASIILCYFVSRQYGDADTGADEGSKAQTLVVPSLERGS